MIAGVSIGDWCFRVWIFVVLGLGFGGAMIAAGVFMFLFFGLGYQLGVKTEKNWPLKTVLFLMLLVRYAAAPFVIYQGVWLLWGTFRQFVLGPLPKP